MNTLAESKSLADAVSRGYVVIREVREGGEVNPDTRAVLKSYRSWCKSKEVPCLELYQFHGDPDWDVCAELPASTLLHDEVEEVLNRYGGAAEVEADRVATTSYLPELVAFNVANELATLLGQKAPA